MSSFGTVLYSASEQRHASKIKLTKAKRNKVKASSSIPRATRKCLSLTANIDEARRIEDPKSHLDQQRISTDLKHIQLPSRTKEVESSRKPIATIALQDNSVTLKITIFLDGKPICITRKVTDIDSTMAVHNLDIVSLEIFDANKKTVHLQKNPIQTDRKSNERDDEIEPVAQSRQFIHNTTSIAQPAGEAAQSKLHTGLYTSLGNTAKLPIYEGRRLFLHYRDNEITPEEKMAKMARYAYTPSKRYIANNPEACKKQLI